MKAIEWYFPFLISKAMIKWICNKILQVDDLRLLVTPFGHDLHVIIMMTCNDLRKFSIHFDQVWIHLQVSTSFSSVSHSTQLDTSSSQYCFLLFWPQRLQ